MPKREGWAGRWAPQQVPSAAVDLRLATLDDAEAIRQIYNREVLGSTVVFDLRPRTIEEQRAWQDDRSGAHAVVVAIDDGDLVGFGSLSAYRDRPAYRTPSRTPSTSTPTTRAAASGVPCWPSSWRWPPHAGSTP